MPTVQTNAEVVSVLISNMLFSAKSSPVVIECILSHFPSFNIVLAAHVHPSLSVSHLKSAVEYKVDSTDEVSRQLTDCKVVILGDLNNLPTSLLEQALGLLEVVEDPTRGTDWSKLRLIRITSLYF